LDSRAAQVVIRNIRRIASSGRSIVCTIHQPSTAIFTSFDSLLLLKRGGQTVYFGSLGENCANLVNFFESAPKVLSLPMNVNPATWMLDVIGAGTGQTGDNDVVDFHQFYKVSSLCSMNMESLEVLMQPNEGSKRITAIDMQALDGYNSTYWEQFVIVFRRMALLHWRTPSYSVSRVLVAMFIALIFGSAFPKQKYTDYIAVVSRSAVIFITTLFLGILALVNVVPVIHAERPVFYREQQSRMYHSVVYAISQAIMEIPFVLMTSGSFVVLFFFIVGFDNIGNVSQKFFWYWCLLFFFQYAMVNIGLMFVALLPSEAAIHGKIFCSYYYVYGPLIILLFVSCHRYIEYIAIAFCWVSYLCSKLPTFLDFHVLAQPFALCVRRN
jgi:hypothetical protein